MKARALLFVVVGALLLGGLFVLMKPAPAPEAATKPSSDTASAAAAPVSIAPATAAHRFEFAIQNGRKSSGPDVMPVMQGDDVTLLLVSDSADEVHVHGYDLEEKLQPKHATALSFKADRSGRFTIELHHSHVELGALEVQPR